MHEPAGTPLQVARSKLQRPRVAAMLAYGAGFLAALAANLVSHAANLMG